MLFIVIVLRLVFNVVFICVVLFYGYEGGDVVGKVIEVFGEVVIGGNYVVGIVVFVIFFIINFKVVIVGVGCILEVSVCFMLDVMFGK